MTMTMTRKNEEHSVRFRGNSERSPSTATEAVQTTIVYCNVSIRTWTKLGIIFSLMDQLLIGGFCVYMYVYKYSLLCDDDDDDDNKLWESMDWKTIALFTGMCAAALSLVFPIFAWQGVRKGSNCLLTVWLIPLFLLIGLYLTGLAGSAYHFYTIYRSASSQAGNSNSNLNCTTRASFCFLWLLFVLTLRIFFLVVTMEFRKEVRREVEEEEEMDDKSSAGFYSQCQSPYPPLTVALEDLELQQQHHPYPYQQQQHQQQYQQQNQYRNPNQNQHQNHNHNSPQFDYQEGLIEPRPYFPHKNSIFLYR